jgi:SAM-dependent methyltransferase
MADEPPVARQIYNTIAEAYAEAVQTKDYNVYIERPAIRALVPPLAGGRALDAGCGPGTNIQWLLDQGAAAVVGMDVSPNMIAIAQRQAGLQATLHVADLSQPLDFLADASFDLVFSSLVVHYLPDQTPVFAELARVLRPGGCFVFSTHHPQSDYEHHPGNYFETVQVTEAWRNFGPEPIEMTFYRRPLSATTEALAQAGFVIERLTEARVVPEFQAINPERYAILRERAPFMCIRARKL